MELQHRPYPALLLKMKEHFTKEQNPEMVAILTAAEYEHMSLIKICNTKMTSVCPSLASEAITTVDMIAEKVAKNWSEDEQTAN
jgi:hypothetical protein